MMGARRGTADAKKINPSYERGESRSFFSFQPCFPCEPGWMEIDVDENPARGRVVVARQKKKNPRKREPKKKSGWLRGIATDGGQIQTVERWTLDWSQEEREGGGERERGRERERVYMDVEKKMRWNRQDWMEFGVEKRERRPWHLRPR